MQEEVLRYLIESQRGTNLEANALLQSPLGIPIPASPTTNAPPATPQTPSAKPQG